MTQENLLWTGIVIAGIAIPIQLLSPYIVLFSTKLAIIVGIFGCSLVVFVIFQWIFESSKDFMEKNIKTPLSRAKEHKKRMESEVSYIKSTIGNNPAEIPSKTLPEYYEKVKRKQFMSEVIVSYYSEWHDYLDTIRNRIQTIEDVDRKEKFKQEDQIHEQYIENLKQEIDAMKQTEEEEETTEQEAFLDEYKDRLYEYTKDLNEQQKQWLQEIGFKKDHQWDIKQKETKEMLIRCRSNEGTSHAYLVGAIWEYITTESIDPDAKMYETKMPDIVFRVGGIAWAIEVETGSVLRKDSVQMQEKVNILNKNYEGRWFFVVANKNLVSKYRQFGEVVERTEVLDKIWEIYDPHGEVAHAMAQEAMG